MVYIESNSTDPAFNLALEQYVFDHLPRDREYFMLWQNQNAVIVGKYQNTAAEINTEYATAHDIKAVRRLSGGGAVYHDLGNVNFTFIADEKNAGKLDLQAFCLPLIRTLAGIGISAQLNGRNDVTIDGHKFSGNAQYMKNGRILHHGTVMFDSDISVMEAVLNVPKDKIESKGIRSVRSRVTCVKNHMKEPCSLSEFKEMLKTNMMEGAGAERYELTDADISAIKEIQAARYDTWEWNYGVSPAYSIEKKRRVEGCGGITVSMNVEGGRITDFSTSGDYFANEDCSAVSDILHGCRLERDALVEAMSNLNIENYYCGLTLGQFIDIIMQ